MKISLCKIREEKDLWGKILSRAEQGDEEAQKVVHAMRNTLGHFRQKHVAEGADSLLKMQALRQFGDTEWDTEDPLVKRWLECSIISKNV